MRQAREILGDSNPRKPRIHMDQGANFRSLKTDSVSKLRKAMPGSEPATASTQQARGTLVHGELSARQADGETMASAGSEFLQFEN